MGEYPSLCVRNMHAVRTQCKILALVGSSTPYQQLGRKGTILGGLYPTFVFFSTVCSISARSRPSNGCSIYTCMCPEGSERSREPAKQV